MNKDLKKINIEEVLFFDSELVRRSEKLEIDSTEYVLYQKKTRNRETDEFLTDEELCKEYEDKAALRMCFNKVVTIGVGFVKDEKAYIKYLAGSEEEVIDQFCKASRKFKYLCGFNAMGFDLPMITNNGYRYFDMTEKLPDPFITNGKKPWNLGQIVDLMDVFKGTHYYNSSLEDICFHFGLPSPKKDIDGSMVSKVFYEEGPERIYEYVKEDVFTVINLFRKMRFEPVFDSYTDRSQEKGSSGSSSEENLLQELYNFDSLTDSLKEKIKSAIGNKKLTSTDKKNLHEILLRTYVRTDFVNGDQDNKASKEAKESEVKQFIESLSESAPKKSKKVVF